MHLVLRILLLSLLTLLPACASTPQSTANLSAEALRVQQQFNLWPAPKDPVRGISRTFVTTIHAAGKRTVATGILRYYGPRDCRLTAVNELGVLLFDARINWAGVTIFRHTPSIDRSIISALIADLSVSLLPPATLANLQIPSNPEKPYTLRHTTAEGTRILYSFSPQTARLLEQQVTYSMLDSLRITYKSYTPQGWPLHLTLARPARLYTIHLTFTDSQSPTSH